MSTKHQAFTKSFRGLLSSITGSVKSLADACWEKNLISKATYDEVQDLNETNTDKARRLLRNVSISIERNPSAFDSFLSALNETFCQDDSEKLISTLAELEKQAEIKTTKTKEAVKELMVAESPVDTNVQKLLVTPYASGVMVVDLCIQKLKLWIPEENKFMKRIAFVMTEFGKRMSTYDSSGGIWQVSSIAFQDTKNNKAHRTLPKKFKHLMDLYQIDWMSVNYCDLDKPLYSALAARLYLSNNPAPIPPCHDVSGQAAYWQYHYMKGGGELSIYSDKILMLEK